MMFAAEQSFGKAEVRLEQMISFIKQAAADGERIDQVERELFALLMEIGREMLASLIALAGDGDVGETLERGEQTLRRLPEQTRLYRSIFGVLEVKRFVYAVRAGQKCYSPLDEELSLPAGEQSYVLEDWLGRFSVQNPFGSAVESLHELLGTSTSKRTAERINQELATYVEPFRSSQNESLAEEEEELLVVTADGKGVPMRSTLEERMGLPEPAWRRFQRKRQEAKADERAAKRLSRGQVKRRKQMAYVGAVYTIARWKRSAKDITDELLNQQSQPERPRPCNKRICAEMTHYREGERWDGQPRLFTNLALQVGRRDHEGAKPLVCLMDGQRSLWNYQRQWLSRAVCLVDIFHVMERLWNAAYCFHKQGSREAEQFVDHYLQMLLENKVSSVIGSLRRKMLTLSTTKRKSLETVLTYFKNNRKCMQYGDYLQQGYPIGSGVVEGACRHLVRDRMERTGMKWQIEGATAMLNTRSAFINGEWDDLIEYRIQTEQQRSYGKAA